MSRFDDLLAEVCDRIAAHARSDSRTAIAGLLASRVETSEPDYELTEPLVVLMAQGGKRLYFDQQVIEYRAGECLVVTAEIPLSGHFIGARRDEPALAVGLQLRPSTIAALLPELPRVPRGAHLRPASGPAIGTSMASTELLDAVARLLRLLDQPADQAVLAPMLEREILWRLLTGPLGPGIAQIAIAGSSLAHISKVIAHIRGNYAEPFSVSELAGMAGMSKATFHRHFRGITGMTPLQFQKCLRLQEARSLLLAQVDDVTGIAHLVGYGSPTQFNREYRRLFGSPPGRDKARLRNHAQASDLHLQTP